MAVREFNGTSDNIVCDVGALSAMTYGTVVALVKPPASLVTDEHPFFQLKDSSDSLLLGVVRWGDIWEYWNGSSYSWTADETADANWQLVVVRKSTGSNAPRFSVYNYSTDTWTHEDGAQSLADSSAPGAGGVVDFDHTGAGDAWDGLIAARAAWSNTLPWSADASGDAAIEAVGLETAAQAWLNASPDAMWLFNQLQVDDVKDITNGGANQTSVSGTSVVTGDDPPGFDFSIDEHVTVAAVEQTSGSGTFNATVPTSEAGDLLLAVSATRFGSVPSTPTGWTQLFAESPGSDVPSLVVFYKVSDGTETVVEYGTGLSSTEVLVYRLLNAQTPEAATSSSTTTVDPDPPSLAPTGGANDYLWIAAAATRDGDPTTPTYPLSDNQRGEGGTTVSLVICTEHSTGSSLDPTTFDFPSDPTGNSVATIAIAPTAAEDTDASAGVLTVTLAGADPMPAVSPTINAADISLAGENATVARSGEPDAAEASFGMAAQGATADTVSDTTEAIAETAEFGIAANMSNETVATVAGFATMGVGGVGPDASASGSGTAGSGDLSVRGQDATVSTSDNPLVPAQTAEFGLAAEGVTPTGEANATAETATLSVAGADSDQSGQPTEASFAISARDATVAINPGIVASSDVALLEMAAQDATVTISGEQIEDTPTDAGFLLSALNATVVAIVPPEPQYSFFPPTVEEHFAHLQHHPFLKKIVWDKGVSLVRRNGTFEETRYVVPDQGGEKLVEGEDYFVGGHHYTVRETVALELIAAGYEPELIED